MRGRPREIRPETFVAYVEGEVTPSEGAAVEAELAESPGARRRIAKLRELSEALSAPLPAIERTDLVVPWRRTVHTGRFKRRSGPWRSHVSVAFLVAAAAVAALTLRLPGDLSPSGFRAKSAGPGRDGQGGGQEGERWAGIQVYRLDESGEAKRLGGAMHKGDGLVFSYTNLGPHPLGHLMVFGVDSQREVRWYYPAHEREGEDPVSIAIAEGAANVALPDVVRHELAPGPLAIHALFTDRPLGVLEVEALASRQADAAARLGVPGAVEHVVTLQVGP